MVRQLVVIRHASARTHGDSDHARPLTQQGQAEAGTLARRIHDAGVCPEVALVSSATRAQETWAAVAARCGACEVEVSEAMYSAGFEAVIEALRLVPAETGTVVYVGHNPTASYLAAVLPDEEVTTEALSQIVSGMPPATAAVFEIEPPWADVGPGTGRLLQVLRGSR